MRKMMIGFALLSAGCLNNAGNVVDTGTTLTPDTTECGQWPTSDDNGKIAACEDRDSDGEEDGRKDPIVTIGSTLFMHRSVIAFSGPVYLHGYGFGGEDDYCDVRHLMSVSADGMWFSLYLVDLNDKYLVNAGSADACMGDGPNYWGFLEGEAKDDEMIWTNEWNGSLALCMTHVNGVLVSGDCDNIDDTPSSGQSVTWFLDADKDTYGGTTSIVSTVQPSGYVARNGDCNDSNAAVNPGVVEIAGNGIDDNCDGTSAASTDPDSDGDGSADSVDCDDTNASVHPGATEIVGDGIDQDCNGSDTAASTTDVDGDTYRSDVDCDDHNAAVHPGATEVNDNSVDENCDGVLGTTSTACTSTQSLVSMSFVAPPSSSDLSFGGEINTASDKKGSVYMPWQTYTTGSPAGMTVTTSGGTTAPKITASYAVCVEDGYTWFPTVTYKTAAGATTWSCTGTGTVTGTFTVTQDGVSVPYSTHDKGGGTGCEIKF